MAYSFGVKKLAMEDSQSRHWRRLHMIFGTVLRKGGGVERSDTLIFGGK
jgi:hypothetical protein